MPALPDRSGRPLPDTADVVVIGGGYTGINAARELARRGVAVTLLEARTLGWGASTRNGGIVHAGYKWGPRELVERYGEETGHALYRETLDGYETVKRLIAEESIDCDFRERGHLELAYAPSHVPGLEHERESLASMGVESHRRPARTPPRGDRLGRLLRRAGRAGQRAAPPGPLLRRARRGRRPGRRRPARGRPRTDDPAPGGRSLRRRDGARRDPRPRRLRRHQRLHRRRRPVAPPADHPDRRATSSPREPLPEDLAAELSPKGRSFFDTKNFLYYWHVSADRRMVFGGRASMMPTSDRAHGRDPPPRPARGPSAAGRPADRLRVGRQRRLHVRPDAARRADEGRRRLRDGLLRDGRRADDPPRHDGRRVAGGRRGAGAGAGSSSRWCPAPYEGRAVVPAVRRGVVPAQGSAGRAVAAGMRIGFRTSPQNDRLGESRGRLGRGGPARRLRLGLAQRPPRPTPVATAADRASRR